MNKRLLLILSGFIFAGTANAADLPTEVIGSENYDKATCVNVIYQQCLNNICLTSEALDCTQQCMQAAIDKCKEQSE